MKNLFLLLFLHPLLIQAQDNKPLAIFEPLMGKTWQAEEAWENGSSFKQTVELSYDLDSSIVIVKSEGYTNQEQSEYGPRNHGIRQYDPTTKEIKFWEFDVFGGLTTGTVFAQGKNIFYQYQYGDTFVTDLWEYINDTTYSYTVGIYTDGKWEKVFLKTEFISTNQ